MLRLQSNLAAHCLAALNQSLDSETAEWDSRSAVGIVLAAGGYPLSYNKGDKIEGLELAASAGRKIFHAGTAEKDGDVVTNGGRVLCATALGESVSEAQAAAYELVKTVHWENVYYRTDIAHRAVRREQDAAL